MPEHATLADQVVEQIVRLIETQDLEAGEELPAVGELAERFAVSRPVVRDALRTLSARGILVTSQGRQARVSTPSADVLGQVMEFRLRRRSIDIADVFAVRELIETEAARLAAARVASGASTASDIAAALERMLADDRREFMDADVRFHVAIADAAGNAVLSFLLEALDGVLREVRERTYDARDGAGRSHEETRMEHRAILDAIAGGDPVAAGEAMHAHLSSTVADVGGGD